MAPKSPLRKTTLPPKSKKINAPALASINYGEVQADEIEALKAIYMDDYEEIAFKSVWGSAASSRKFKLKLRSFSDEESFVLLTVELTTTYPKTLPNLEVTHMNGFHERTQSRVKNIVKKRPLKLVNEVMIHEIATEIQEALEDAVQARQNGVLPSLEDERTSAEEVAAALAREAENAEARRIQEEQEDERRVLKLMVEEEISRRDKRIKSHATKKVDDETHAVDGSDVVRFEQSAVISTESGTVVFDAVTIINTLQRSKDDEIFLARARLETNSIYDNNYPLVKLRRVIVKRREDVVALESRLERLIKLRHPGLSNVLTFKCNRLDSNRSQVIVCMEYAAGFSLADALQLGAMYERKARSFAVLILEALDHLHRNGLSHGNLSCASVIIDNQSAATPKLNVLSGALLDNINLPLPHKWRPEPQQANFARQTDIWQFGVVVLQMFFGLDVLNEYSSPEALFRGGLSDEFEDFARKIFTGDPKGRPSAFDLLPAEFLRTDVPVRKQPLVTARRAVSGGVSPAYHRSRLNSSNMLEPLSRYAADFTEIGRLGKGGFGEVVKARNKLDGGVYAIKKIRQAPNLLDKVLSEVMLLNRLNHPYVVRYYSTWVENDVDIAIEDSSTTATTTDKTDETSSDGPRIDFGYQSTGGLDFVSSSGYPNIEFGDDEEEEEEEGDDDDDDNADQDDGSDVVIKNETDLGNADHDGGNERSANNIRVEKTSSKTFRLPSILYIQMEFCERQTLRDLIRKTMTSDDVWRYVRQITEGLAHIHGHQIIHRDLKPDNIFIDFAGSPKIGDFGLATVGQSHLSGPSHGTGSQSGGGGGGDMTKSVGTVLYVAPELRSSAGGQYNDRVDMYSLGIMFFEMCEQFSTAMERIQALEEIREKAGDLPPTYRVNGEKAAQGRLIRRLVSHKPSERPSSTELLRSDMLPLKMEDETIRQALASLSDPQSPYHQRIMSALFTHDNANAARVKALVWDAKGAASSEDADRLRMRGVAHQALERVFRRHGAEEAKRDAIFPRSDFYTDANVVQLLDASGNLVQLPYDLTLPHARQLARHASDVKRSFAFGNAYRDAFNGGAPRVSEEVDFDIISNRNDDLAFDEAEVLRVMDEIIEEIPSMNANITFFYINHAFLLDVILDHCRVSTGQLGTVKEIISKLGFQQWTWTKVRGELRRFGLTDSTLDDLQQFDFRDTPDKAFSTLKGLLADCNARLKVKLDAGITALRELLAHASHLKLRRKTYVSCLASVNAKFFDGGILFQCVVERKASKRHVIAAGGRYDSLIKAHKTIGQIDSDSVGAVGISIGLDNMVNHMSKQRGGGGKAYLKKAAAEQPIEPRCQVLVRAVGSAGVRDLGISVVTSLWASDISAELCVDARQYEAREHGFVVTLRHEASTTIRLRSTDAGAEETDVPVTSLVGHLNQELRERAQLARSTRPALLRPTSHQDGERKSAVHVLMAEHRSKKSNKYHIVEAAQQRWFERLREMQSAPILAVETRDEVVDAIGETRLGDAEGWRKAIQGVPPNERKYVQQVHDVFEQWQKKWREGDGQREAGLFNFRTGRCVYYDLGS